MSASEAQSNILLCNEVHRLLLFEYRRRGLDGASENYRHTVGDTSVYPAVIIGKCTYHAVARDESIVIFAAAQVASAEAYTEFDALYPGNSEKRVRELPRRCRRKARRHPRECR